MLHEIYLPLVITGWRSGANWLMTFSEATIGIGVFTENQATFDAGVAMWRDKTPTTIYMLSDGSHPIPQHPPWTPEQIRASWSNPSSYIEGLQMETLRDLSSHGDGAGAMSNAAETARIQGVDLFGEERARILAGYELQARYVNEYLDEVARRGGAEPASDWRPRRLGRFQLPVRRAPPPSRVGDRLQPLRRPGGHRHAPDQATRRTHPALTGTALHMSWETLTHAR
jgi:hypothetical protein